MEGGVERGRETRDASGDSPVYLPAEDTSALARALRDYSGMSCLEIGFGSGTVLANLLPRFELVVGTDLLTLAQAVRVRQGVPAAEVFLCDRARCFRDGVFDLVAFNPPYLPSEGIEDRAVDGGAGGLQVPLSFLDEAVRVVRPSGRVVLLLSDEADIEEFEGACRDRGLRVAVKSTTPLFFENLTVFEVSR